MVSFNLLFCLIAGKMTRVGAALIQLLVKIAAGVCRLWMKTVTVDKMPPHEGGYSDEGKQHVHNDTWPEHLVGVETLAGDLDVVDKVTDGHRGQCWDMIAI